MTKVFVIVNKTFVIQSARNKRVGLMREARHAGSAVAVAATARTRAVTATKVTGSVAVTPNSRLARKRVAARATAMPMAAVERHTQALAEDHGGDAAASGADGHADADLELPLADPVGTRP